MKLTVLCENTARNLALHAEHGLSLYIEHAGRRILFDAGQSDVFARNAATLGMDLAAVDTAVLSHGHYDHGGGMLTFLAQNATAPLYLQRTAFEPHYNGTEKYIGLDAALAASPRLHFADEHASLGDGMTLFCISNASLPYPIDAHGLTQQIGDTFIPDPFTHEQYLLIEDAGRRILVSGCSHKGILNLMAVVKPDIFIGGFHLMKLDPTAGDKAALESIAAALASYRCRYYTGHCTGEAPFAFLKERLGDRLVDIRTGDSLQI